MREGHSVLECAQAHGLSILYLRCNAYYYSVSVLDFSNTFNSLFEMHMNAIDSRILEAIIPFNSLFEMRWCKPLRRSGSLSQSFQFSI